MTPEGESYRKEDSGQIFKGEGCRPELDNFSASLDQEIALRGGIP